MSTVLVVAPHPDDETLGCGGTMLRHEEQGDTVHWLIVTHIAEELGFEREQIEQREREIELVAERYGIEQPIHLRFPTTRLDSQPMSALVEAIGNVFQEIKPELIYIPYRNDIHTDHATVFDAVTSCTKWFRYPSVERVLAYETLSETEFALDPDARGFRPNVFIDITGTVEEKIDIMRIYTSEIGAHPFPRSESAMRARATIRGSTSGFEAAEAFMLLKERVS
ncbi:PIG-L deacetylase family protein [Salinibacter ruber]|uniref:PIG-L deacetylase family protein n=1 Tax=Salinibacter ruber TaxID=146919 RepID=UPI00216860E4|nr:PIG-L deacetylase family protein [Salinibacter ruber]MCS4174464.1 LmbE family N-acetylglucosaminyl deacetylase [Salinibacter ruber]